LQTGRIPHTMGAVYGPSRRPKISDSGRTPSIFIIYLHCRGRKNIESGAEAQFYLVCSNRQGLGSSSCSVHRSTTVSQAQALALCVRPHRGHALGGGGASVHLQQPHLAVLVGATKGRCVSKTTLRTRMSLFTTQMRTQSQATLSIKVALSYSWVD